MDTAYISLGSNLSESEAKERISNAETFLTECSVVFSMSDVYTTPSVSGDGTNYCNAVAFIRTNLTFDRLNLALKRWEELSGRDADARAKKIVPIDLDIVIFNGKIVRQNDFDREYFQLGYLQLRSDRLQPEDDSV